MRPHSLLASIVFSLAAVQVVNCTNVTPLGKVIEMMEKILATAKEGKKAEEVEFSKFKQWCAGVQKDRTRSIKEGASKIEFLNADIDKASSDAGVLGEEASEHQANSATATAEAANATAIRDKEHADYLEAHGDYSDAIDAIGRALQVVKSRSADVPQKAALLQLRQQHFAFFTMKDKSLLDAFLGLGQAPAANAYEFQSSSVVDMLEKLESKVRDERLALEKAEMNSKHNHEVLMQRLTDNIKASDASASEKTSAKAGRLEDKASSEGDLAVTTKAKTEDEASLQETLSECHSRSQEYEQNQVTRADEITAVEKAIEILNGDAVKGHAETYLPSFVQKPRQVGRATHRTALAQLRSTNDSPLRSRTAAYLQEQSAKLQSRYLSVVASHVAEDPFAKVKKLISDLLVKLMEEANAEADQHAYCTSELATNKKTRENVNADVEKLTAETEKLTAEATQLASDLQRLSDEVAEIRGQQAEATTIRADEKKTNAKTISDAKEAQAAVEKAIEVLRDFYGSSLLQRDTKRRVTQREPYTGMTDDSTGVLGMLDVILSDFARLESETSSAEDEAATGHTAFMADSTQNVEVKSTEIKHKEGKKRQVQEALGSAEKQLELTHEELEAANTYYDKLKSECVETGLSYAERRAHRQEEIASLQEALKMLDGESLY